MKIFATFYEPSDSGEEIYRIGLTPEAFNNPRHSELGFYHSSESDMVYFYEINDPEKDLTDPNLEDWIPYNGKFGVDNGWIINNRFISEDCSEWPEEIDEDDDLDDHGPRVIKYEIYEKGKLIDVKLIEEEW